LDVRRETVAERESGKTPMDKGADLLFRAVILTRFKEFLESDKDHSHLAPLHFKFLDQIGRSLIASASQVEQRPVPRSKARRRIEIRNSRQRTWEVQPSRPGF
jgi:hypothetical protein